MKSWSKVSIMILLVMLCCVGSYSGLAEIVQEGFTHEELENLPDQDVVLQSIVFGGGAYYALTNTSILTWGVDFAETKVFCEIPVTLMPSSREAYLRLSDEDKDQVAYGITHLFYGDNFLWGFNVYSGGICKISKGSVCWEKQILNCSEIAYPDDEDLQDYNIMGYIEDDTLRFMVGNTIYVWDFITNTQTICELQFDALSFVPYTTGKVLLSVLQNNDEMAYENALFVLDFKDFKVEPLNVELSKFDANINDTSKTSILGLAYSKEEDAIYYQARNIHMTEDGMLCCSKSGAPFEKLGIIRDTNLYCYASTGKYAVWNGTGALREYDIQALRSTDSMILRIKGLFPCDDSKLRSFSDSHPGLTVSNQIVNLDDNDITALISQTSDVDIYAIYANQLFSSAVQKGFASDLSGNTVIASSVAQMYPAIVESISDENGKIWGYPTFMNLSLWQVDNELWTAVFADRPYPQTYVELFNMMKEWDNDYSEQYGEINFYGPFDLSGLLYEMVYQYVTEFEESDKPLDFADSSFCEAMNAFDEMIKSIDLSRFMSNNDMGGETLIIGGNIQVENNRNLFQDGNSKYKLICQPGFLADKPAPIRGDVIVLFVNSLSSHIDEAMQFVEYFSVPENVDPILYYALHENCIEPVEDPRYSAETKQLQQDIDTLKVQMTDADNASIDAFQAEIEKKELQIEEWDTKRWIVTEKGVSRYRQWLTNTRFSAHSLYLSQNDLNNAFYTAVNKTCKQYIEGGMTVNQFISKLTDISRMIWLEH